MYRLTNLTRHYTVAIKLTNGCPNMTNKCIPQAHEFAKAVLVLQTNPQIIDENWRKNNPFLTVNYMGDHMMTFNTEQLYKDIEIAGRPDCKCAPKIIFPSDS